MSGLDGTARRNLGQEFEKENLAPPTLTNEFGLPKTVIPLQLDNRRQRVIRKTRGSYGHYPQTW
jgi:hypothetical protein